VYNAANSPLSFSLKYRIKVLRISKIINIGITTAIYRITVYNGNNIREIIKFELGFKYTFVNNVIDASIENVKKITVIGS